MLVFLLPLFLNSFSFPKVLGEKVSLVGTGSMNRPLFGSKDIDEPRRTHLMLTLPIKFLLLGSGVDA